LKNPAFLYHCAKNFWLTPNGFLFRLFQLIRYTTQYSKNIHKKLLENFSELRFMSRVLGSVMWFCDIISCDRFWTSKKLKLILTKFQFFVTFQTYFQIFRFSGFVTEKCKISNFPTDESFLLIIFKLGI